MQYGCQSMTGKIQSILLKSVSKAFISQQNIDAMYDKFGYLGRPDYKKAVLEYKVFKSVIEEHVPEVHCLPEDSRTGLDSLYVHDSLKMTGRGAIYFPMGKKLRGKEWLATRDYLEAVGVPTLGRIEPPGKMEGGDIVWLDEKTVAIGRWLPHKRRRNQTV